MTRQPFLHQLAVDVAAPLIAISGRDGQIRPDGVQGVFDGDTRVLSRAVVEVDGTAAVALQELRPQPGVRCWVAAARGLGDPGSDVTVLLERSRRVAPDRVVESIALVSQARVTVSAQVSLGLGCDFAPMNDVRSGVPRAQHPTAPGFGASNAELRWTGPDDRVALVGVAPEPDVVELDPASFGWEVELPPGGRWQVEVTVSTSGGAPAAVVPASAEPLRTPQITAADRRVALLVQRSVEDLHGLRLADPLAPADVFLGAGAPWYLTLFGRDSLWAARMMLPLGTDLALGTLRTLARRQGTVHDPEAAEQPGKILHELRAAGQGVNTGTLRLPPVYYGTVDATALWLSLLHDAWRWGLADADVESLLPAAEAALRYLLEESLDAEGFLSYQDLSGHGLANQGWKDSAEAVQFADGTVATAPIALCEAQGYAVAAATETATLLEAYGRTGGDAAREWAGGLAERFRARFWVDAPADGGPPFPAVALAAGGRRVDTVTSNIGHLLDTGLLNARETAAVVRRLGSPELVTGYGLRTMSSASRGFRAQSYHCGSVWTHDTAVVLAGLAAVGTPASQQVAAALISGLLDAAEAFDYQLPELFGGEPATPGGRPIPYPTSCHPQAWSAASAVLLLAAAAGISPDVPGGTLTLNPLRPSPFGAFTVRGLRVAGESLDLSFEADGSPTVLTAPATLRVQVS